MDNPKKVKSRKPYKDPVFLFTSSSLRHAARAGWHSAFGNKEDAEKLIHMAYAEWSKEMGAGRKYNFLGFYSNDIWEFVSPETLKNLVDNFLKNLKKEIKKAKNQK